MLATSFSQLVSSRSSPVMGSVVKQLPRQFPSVQSIFRQHLEQPQNSMMNPKSSVSRTGTLPGFALSSTNIARRCFSTQSTDKPPTQSIDELSPKKAKLARFLAFQADFPDKMLMSMFQSHMKTFEDRIGRSIDASFKKEVWDIVSPGRLAIFREALAIHIYHGDLSQATEETCALFLNLPKITNLSIKESYLLMQLRFDVENPEANDKYLKGLVRFMIPGVGEDIRHALNKKGIYVPD